jgi:hypothetical protein
MNNFVYIYSPDRMSRNTWYRRVLRSIMPPSARFKLQQFVVDPLKARNAKSSKYPETNPQTRNKLLKHYAPHNKVLSELIARNLTHWGKMIRCRLCNALPGGLTPSARIPRQPARDVLGRSLQFEFRLLYFTNLWQRSNSLFGDDR